MSALAIAKPAALPALQMDEKELMSVLQNSLYPGAKEESIKLVVGYCRASGLDPMQKPVHLVPMSVKKAGTKDYEWRDVVMPGIGLYRTQAARSGAYAGMTEPEFGEDVTENIGNVTITYPRWCKITIKRQMPNGAIVEFTAMEFWKENYATAGKDTAAPNTMWKKRPYAQLAKCAEAQALRKAFPEIGAAPTAEEMEGKPVAYEDDYKATTIDGSTGEIIPPKQTALPNYTAEQFAANLPKWADLIRSGKKSADQIIATVSSKATLSDEQKATIRTVKAAPPQSDVMTEEEIAAARAKEMEEANANA
jgi:phage recombination protein Bet